MVHMDETPSHVMSYTRWQVFGVCASPSPNVVRVRDEIFYDYMGRPRKTPLSTAFCSACPVSRLCLEDAIVHDEKHGVWGGFTYEERVRLYPQTRISLLLDAAKQGWLDWDRLSDQDQADLKLLLRPKPDPIPVEVPQPVWRKAPVPFRFQSQQQPPRYAWHKAPLPLVQMAG